ncbi:unnamed protein product [Pieris brassicae]|uniref:Uncharacterized protein n=1 Tax=Pieris brassicae TaxID=7116 RepID=A0A9P0TIG2_PIEBR|nr:unnamed protein product [Pieris brassicae]
MDPAIVSVQVVEFPMQASPQRRVVTPEKIAATPGLFNFDAAFRVFSSLLIDVVFLYRISYYFNRLGFWGVLEAL